MHNPAMLNGKVSQKSMLHGHFPQAGAGSASGKALPAFLQLIRTGFFRTENIGLGWVRAKA